MLDLLNLHPLRDRRRRAVLETPIPADWRGFVEANVAHFARLEPDEQARLLDDARLFVAEKIWEGGNGHVVTDEMKITIAAEACLLLLGWDDARRADLFSNVGTVIVYPAGYRVTKDVRRGLIQSTEESHRLGEAWSSDLPIVLSWRDARDGGLDPSDGHNVVLHEFAHKLDMLRDGSADGVPSLRDDAEYEAWASVMSAAFAELVEDAEKGHKTFLDHYGATNEAEFFAVATEAFFEKAARMRDDHPALYAVLRNYYQQDPASREK